MALAIAIGGGSRLLPIGAGLWDKSVGDVAYAVLLGFIVAFVQPRAHALATASSATAICIAIEVFQLSGIPARAPRVLRVLLGDTFAWHDVACYVVGGTLVGLTLAVHARVTAPKNAIG